jgi:hypothetical protein
MVQSRPVLNPYGVQPIKQLAPEVHPVLDLVVKPKLERRDSSFV